MTILSLLSRPAHGDRELRDWLRRPLGGPRQVTVVNPKGGAGKTVATLMLGLTFGQARGGYVLAWDNNETQGTLGMRAQLRDHQRTVRDLLRDLHRFTRGDGGIAELADYLRGRRRRCSTSSPPTRPRRPGRCSPHGRSVTCAT